VIAVRPATAPEHAPVCPPAVLIALIYNRIIDPGKISGLELPLDTRRGRRGHGGYRVLTVRRTALRRSSGVTEAAFTDTLIGAPRGRSRGNVVKGQG
jgi:hypothetical protein